MIELFASMPNNLKIQIQKFIDGILNKYDLIEAVKIIADFSNSCSSEEEQDFIDFYFNIKMEQLKNESNSD